MLIYYAVPAGIVFLGVLVAFLADSTTPKTNLTAWTFVFTAALLWPVTLPFIVAKRVAQRRSPAPPDCATPANGPVPKP